MEKLNKNADVVISIEGNEYALYKTSPLSKYPHMVDLSTGEIPNKMQRTLLVTFLSQKDIDTNGKTTHWCVRKAIEIV